METIKININVNLCADKSLTDLISSIAALHNHQPQPRPQIEAKEEVKKPTEEAKPEPQPQPQQEPAQEQEQPEPQPEPEPEAAKEKKEYTEVDVRAAMDRTRKRIEGEDYKEKTDSEGYKKWHRALTSWFKTTASAYGADKPSALPDSNSREYFINDCDNVIISDKGQLEIPAPF